MSADGLTEKLIGCFDCKQGAVRAVRFNGECMFLFLFTIPPFNIGQSKAGLYLQSF